MPIVCLVRLGQHTESPKPVYAEEANQNPEFFSGLDHMKAQATKYIELVKACPPIDDTKPVRLPGERTNIARRVGGSDIELSQELIDDLALLATQFGAATTIFKG
jgi:LDH2 family malate/lactate/ureidoglycolate dehydrogenase